MWGLRHSVRTLRRGVAAALDRAGARDAQTTSRSVTSGLEPGARDPRFCRCRERYRLVAVAVQVRRFWCAGRSGLFLAGCLAGPGWEFLPGRAGAAGGGWLASCPVPGSRSRSWSWRIPVLIALAACRAWRPMCPIWPGWGRSPMVSRCRAGRRGPRCGAAGAAARWLAGRRAARLTAGA